MTVDLAKLEALEKAATPGPWEVEGRRDAWIAAPHPKLGSVPIVVPHVMQVADDLDFIAEARNAFPELVREVRELSGIAEAARVQHLEGDCLTCSWMRDTGIIGMCVMAHELAEYDAGGLIQEWAKASRWPQQRKAKEILGEH